MFLTVKILSVRLLTHPVYLSLHVCVCVCADVQTSEQCFVYGPVGPAVVDLCAHVQLVQLVGALGRGPVLGVLGIAVGDVKQKLLEANTAFGHGWYIHKYIHNIHTYKYIHTYIHTYISIHT